jgi:hypothetical protein
MTGIGLWRSSDGFDAAHIDGSTGGKALATLASPWWGAMDLHRRAVRHGVAPPENPKKRAHRGNEDRPPPFGGRQSDGMPIYLKRRDPK